MGRMANPARNKGLRPPTVGSASDQESDWQHHRLCGNDAGREKQRIEEFVGLQSRHFAKIQETTRSRFSFMQSELPLRPNLRLSSQRLV
jgi:hypothetical protein